MKRPKQPSKKALTRRLKEAQDAVEVCKQQASYWKYTAEAAETKRKQQVAGLAADLASARQRLEAMTNGILKHPRCQVGVIDGRCLDTFVIDGLVRVCAQVRIDHLQGIRQFENECLLTELANRLAEMVRVKVFTEIKITP